MADVTIFNAGSLFSTLAANGAGAADPLSRALRSAVVEPAGLQGIAGDSKPLVQPGLSADLPALISRPLQIEARNVLLLAAEAVGRRIDGLQQEVDALKQEIEQALIDSDSGPRNAAGAFLSSLDFASLRETGQQNADAPAQEVEAEPAEISPGAARNPDAVLGDFDRRPSEGAVFGAAYAGLAADASLTTQFDGRVALTEGAQVALSDLILTGTQTAGGGPQRTFVVALNGALQEDGTLAETSGRLVDSGGTAIANGTRLSEAELASSFFEADVNKRALDYLSIIEIRDGPGFSPDERGDFQTVALSSNLAPQDRRELRDEAIRDFTFFTESGVSFTSIDLALSGVNDEGVSDALSAIEAGFLRVTVREIFADGSVNEAVVDRRESAGDLLQADFARQAAQAGVESLGLRVEVRALDPAFDISTIDVRAIFG
ncbi:MAG: hypothetical protein RIB45_16065 [Marivibrio sp.]|uniref:hypothetical protein n=1 Tax=Marivibrio sp. TaxID=2039719 RepID=UPI0032EBD7C2